MQIERYVFVRVLDGIVFAVAVLSLLYFVMIEGFLFRVVSPDLALAKLNGVGRRYNRAMPVNLGMIVTLRIKLVGTPLIGALAIIPASIARDFSQNIGWDVIVSLVLDVRFFV